MVRKRWEKRRGRGGFSSSSAELVASPLAANWPALRIGGGGFVRGWTVAGACRTREGEVCVCYAVL